MDRIREGIDGVLGGLTDRGDGAVNDLAGRGEAVVGDAAAQGQGLGTDLVGEAQAWTEGPLDQVVGDAVQDRGGLAEAAGDLLWKVTGG